MKIVFLSLICSVALWVIEKLSLNREKKIKLNACNCISFKKCLHLVVN